MLLKRKTLEGIARGTISLAFRRWRRPTVKRGGTLITVIGQLAIESVDVVGLDEITEAEAQSAGFVDLDSLRARLGRPGVGDVYRVRLHLAGPDPRTALREAIPNEEELALILRRLGRFDSRSTDGAWTLRVLSHLDERSSVRAADLAGDLGLERITFKTKVRKLKALGLTESLGVGYRLSPRGEAVLRELRRM